MQGPSRPSAVNPRCQAEPCALDPPRSRYTSMEATDRENLMRVLPYLLEIERQCKLALAAAGHMNTCTEAFWPLADPPSAIGDFDYAQRFVSSAAAISRILYAPKDQARHLCDLLG